MSIDSQLLNLTGGIKTSGHIKSNFGATIGVGTDAPTGIVEVQHSQPTLVVQQQATSGASVTSHGKLHATSGTLHIQSGVDATSDSKGDIVLGSVGSATKHVVVKGATSRVGIGSDDPAYGLDVVPESRFTGNVITSNISANAITLNELSLGVTQGLDNVVNVDNSTANTIAMSNVDESVSTTTGALTVAGGIGVGGNVHCSNLYASNITMNLVSFTGLQTFEQVVNNGRVLDSNVLIISNATPSTSSTTGALTLTGGGLGVAGNVHVGTAGQIVVSNASQATSSTTGALTVAGGVGVAGNVHIGSKLSVSNLAVTGETVEVANLAVTSGSLELTQVANVFQVKSSSNVVTEYVRSKKLIKYPRVAMSAATSGGYTASASNENTGAARYAYKAFDNDRITEWQLSGTNNSSAEGYDLTSPYNANSNSPTITDNNGNNHTGAWVKLQLPGAIKISSMYIYAIQSNRRPDSAVLLGSNDDSTWYVIEDTFTVANQDENTISVTKSSYYQYVMLLVKSLTGNEGQLQIKEIEYYGIPEYDPDAHGTDVIARSVPNVPNTDWLEVYYDGQDYTSMPSSVTDKSGNGVTGTPNGGVGFDTEYKAFTFDGVDDYVKGTIPSSLSGNHPYSFSMWLKPNAIQTGYIAAFEMGNRAINQSCGLYFNGGLIVHLVYGNNLQATTSIVANQWIHIVGTYTSGSRKVYADGVLLTSDTYSSLNIGATEMTLGANNDDGQLFNGSIANFRIFNRVLTTDEIWQLYAYQKDYFKVSPDVVTFKAGRLGIGTEEPKAVLDVQGETTFTGMVDIGGDVKVQGQTIYPNKLWNIDFTGQSDSVYYPIVFQTHHSANLQIPPTFISVTGASLSSSDPYNENTIMGYVRGGAQTDHRPFFDLRASNFNTESRISGIWYNNPGSFMGFVVYARGGYAYNILTDALSVSGETSAYSSGGGTFAIKNANGTDSSGTSANIVRIVDFYNRTRETTSFHASSGSTYVGGLPQNHAVYGGAYDAVTKCVHVNSLPHNMMKMMLPTSGSTTPKSFPYALSTSYLDNSGTSSIDYVDITKDPYNRACQVFRCKGTNGGVSGGWGGTRIACHPSRSYMSVVFVKRSGSSSSGAAFYHGCDTNNTVNLSGTIKTNPYFHSISYNSLPNGVWCVSIGFVHFYGASSGYNTGKGGLYRLDTMQKFHSGVDYAFRSNSSYQSQRAFFYNNTTSGRFLDFWNPGWYEHQDMNSEAGLLNLFTNDLTETSDDRLKSDERFIRGALDTIMKLKPQVYKKKITLDDTVKDNTLIQESGLVAQEIYYDAPELRHLVKPGDDYGAITNAVQTSDDPAVDPDYSEWGANPASVNYRGLIPYTVKAIQEIHTEMPRVKYRMTGVPYTNLTDYVGMCVRSVSGNDIVLSSSVEDRAVVGVVSATQNSSESENSDVLVETRGRGHVWVLNTANVSVGEYLTTSNVCGYAQIQGDDLLHSYTVAKALQNVDFVNNARPRRVAKKALSTVRRWVRTEYRQIPQSVYDKLSEASRRQSVRPLPILGDEAGTDGVSDEVVYEEIIREESRVELPGFELKVREETVDDLDEHGQIQWEDDPSGATEPAYEIRYLTADGQITDEANAVHIAAFVGCTYHCG